MGSQKSHPLSSLFTFPIAGWRVDVSISSRTQNFPTHQSDGSPGAYPIFEPSIVPVCLYKSFTHTHTKVFKRSFCYLCTNAMSQFGKEKYAVALKLSILKLLAAFFFNVYSFDYDIHFQNWMSDHGLERKELTMNAWHKYRYSTYNRLNVKKTTQFHMLGQEIVSHYVAFIYEIRSHATQFRFCTRSNFRDTIAFYPHKQLSAHTSKYSHAVGRVVEITEDKFGLIG